MPSWVDVAGVAAGALLLGAAAWLKSVDGSWFRRAASWGEHRGAAWALRRRHRGIRPTGTDTDAPARPEDTP